MRTRPFRVPVTPLSVCAVLGCAVPAPPPNASVAWPTLSEIVSTINGKSEDMITMFNLDGDRLLLTHYCGAGNQPRMRASASPDGKTVTFDFVDATNLKSSSDPHMYRVVFNFIDPNHHTEEWHFQLPGKEMVETFDLQKKS